MGANGSSPNAPSFKYEKRQHPRFTFETTAFAEVANRRISGEAATGFKVLTANVGEGGLLVTTDHPLSIGDLLRTVFPKTDDGPVELMAKVVWMRKNSVRLLGWYTAGLAFQPAGQPGTASLVRRAMSAGGHPSALVPREEDR